MYDTQTPYAASYVLVSNDEGKIAFVLRSNTDWMNSYYGLPSGKTEKKESFAAGAVREAKEEIGIDVTEQQLKPAIVVHRFSTNQDKGDMEWVDMYFEVSEYGGEAHNAEPHMHSELAWLDPEDLPENVIPSVAASLKAWREGKTYFEYGWDQPLE